MVTASDAVDDGAITIGDALLMEGDVIDIEYLRHIVALSKTKTAMRKTII